MYTVHTEGSYTHSILCILCIDAGYEVVDLDGVLGWGLSTGPDEGGEVQRDIHRHHPQGDPERAGLPALGGENAQGHQRYGGRSV